MKAIIKFVGKEYWPWPQDHIREVREQGPSIRIAPDSIPPMPAPYPVVFAHPRGTFTVDNGMTIEDLFVEFGLEGHIPPNSQPEDYVEDGLPKLSLIDVFRQLDGTPEYDRIVDKYQVEFHYALTHYSYITSTVVVIGDNGEGLDLVEMIEGMGHEVEPIRVIREEGTDE